MSGDRVPPLRWLARISTFVAILSLELPALPGRRPANPIRKRLPMLTPLCSTASATSQSPPWRGKNKEKWRPT
jgi:hypothetical protein